LAVLANPGPDPVNDGGQSQMQAMYDADGPGPNPPVDVTAGATWSSLTPAVCSVDAAGLVTTIEACADDVCTVQAQYTGGITLTTPYDLTVTNDETAIAYQADMACNPVTDGSAIDCSGTNDYAADGCVLGPSACVPTCTLGCAVDPITDEGCIDASYDAACGSDSVAGVLVTDDEAGTFDTLTATVCSDANDVVDPSVSCTNPDRVSSADGCNRGPAVCVWSCAGDCGELCANGAYTGTCTDGVLVSSDGAIAINDETVVFYQADMVCNAIPDGGALDCSGSNDYAADGCPLGPSACVPVCIAGDCPPVELCADGSLDVQCGTDIVIGVTVNDDEAGTFDTLTATVCSDAADAVDPSVSCTNPDRISSADGCNRGPAVCVWNCAGDCGELCANGAYTGTCTDGALVSSDGAIAINDETVVFSVGIVPATEQTVGPGANINFDCTASFADSCTYNCDLTALWSAVGCPASSIVAGDYTADPAGGCTDVVTAVEATLTSNGTTVVVGFQWLDVQPDGPLALNDGETIQLTAIHTIDGDVTAIAAWVDLNGICNVAAGLVTAPEGCADVVCNIQATHLTESGSELVNVTNDETAAISVALIPGSAVLDDGETVQFTCLADYADFCTFDCTLVATWTEDPVCDGWVDMFGLFTQATPACGESVTVLYNAQSDTAIVNPPSSLICESIAIDMDPISIFENFSQLLTATCTWSDLSTTDCTATATWTVTGDLTNVSNLVTANDILSTSGICDDAGAGDVTAEDLGCCPTCTDTNAVTVVNDDWNIGIAVNAPSNVLEGDTVEPIVIIESCSDGFTIGPATGSTAYIASGDCEYVSLGGDTTTVTLLANIFDETSPGSGVGNTVDWQNQGNNTPEWTLQSQPKKDGRFGPGFIVFPVGFGGNPKVGESYFFTDIKPLIQGMGYTNIEFSGEVCTCNTDAAESEFIYPGYNMTGNSVDNVYFTGYSDTTPAGNCDCATPAGTDRYQFTETIPCTGAELVCLVGFYMPGGDMDSQERNLADNVTITAWQTVGGEQSIHASEVPCGAGGSCILASSGAISNATVTVDNDDTLVSSLISAPANVLEGGAINWSVIESWSLVRRELRARFQQPADDYN
jgi:hypothetical protein